MTLFRISPGPGLEFILFAAQKVEARQQNSHDGVHQLLGIKSASSPNKSCARSYEISSGSGDQLDQAAVKAKRAALHLRRQQPALSSSAGEAWGTTPTATPSPAHRHPVGGAVTAGLPAMSGIPNNFGGALVRGAMGNTLSQGIGVATGLQEQFDWRGVAAATVAAGVSYGVSNALGGDGLPNGQAGPVRPPAFSDWGSTGEFLRRGLTSVAAGSASVLVRGGSVRRALPGLFADAIGGAVQEGFRPQGDSSGDAESSYGRGSLQEDRLGDFIEQNQPAWEQRQANVDRTVDVFGQDDSGNRYPGEQIARGSELLLSPVQTDADSLNAQIGRRLAPTQQRQAVTQEMLGQAQAQLNAITAQQATDRSLNNIQSMADAYRASEMSGSTGDAEVFLGRSPAADGGTGLRIGSRLGVNLQMVSEGLNPGVGAIDNFARGFAGNGDWSVLEGEKPLSYSLGGAARTGLGLVYDGLTGAGDFRSASQSFGQGDYVSSAMYGLRGIGSAGMTAITLGDFALAKAAFAGTVGSTGLNTGFQVFRGGAYGRLEGGPGIQRHHMPANSVNPMTTYSGPAIQIEVRDHVLTSSHGAQGLAGAEYRAEIHSLIQAGEMRNAMAREIWDVRRAAVEGGGSVTKYNGAIREMLEYSHGRGLLGK